MNDALHRKMSESISQTIVDDILELIKAEAETYKEIELSALESKDYNRATRFHDNNVLLSDLYHKVENLIKNHCSTSKDTTESDTFRSTEE